AKAMQIAAGKMQAAASAGFGLAVLADQRQLTLDDKEHLVVVGMTVRRHEIAGRYRMVGHEQTGIALHDHRRTQNIQRLVHLTSPLLGRRRFTERKPSRRDGRSGQIVRPIEQCVMDSFAGIEAFAAVVERGSFTAAAASLQTAKSSISETV